MVVDKVILVLVPHVLLVEVAKARTHLIFDDVENGCENVPIKSNYLNRKPQVVSPQHFNIVITLKKLHFENCHLVLENANYFQGACQRKPTILVGNKLQKVESRHQNVCRDYHFESIFSFIKVFGPHVLSKAHI